MTLSPDSPTEDERFLARDKYDGDRSAITQEDRSRLASGEPLAYVIGWQPFLGLRLTLASKPLIPRPETEWWTEELIAHARAHFGGRPFSLLDLCAGSGAIGLSIAKHLPNAHVTLAEIDERHAALIKENAAINDISAERIEVVTGDLFAPLTARRFDIIATNPPYIPSGRALPHSVAEFEPHEALFAGTDGLAIIRKIISGAREHLTEGGRLWLEADIEHIETAVHLFEEAGAKATILKDQYERPRVVVAYW